jgi:hypothetical protein
VLTLATACVAVVHQQGHNHRLAHARQTTELVRHGLHRVGDGTLCTNHPATQAYAEAIELPAQWWAP